MHRLRTWLPTAWAVVLACLMLGPALGHGFVLTYDMVWVPDLTLGSDVLGLGSGLPRAVPSDAVVAVADEVVPGMVLQKIVLVGALAAAGAGAAALVGRQRSLGARLVAASVAVWSPYVVERLWLGHWPMLLAYAAVPWLALAGRRRAACGRLPRWWLLVLLVGSLSASAGIVSGLVLLGCAARRSTRPVRPVAGVVAGVVAANLPWLVAGVAHATTARAATGFDVFGLRGDALPAPLAALAGAGVWNAETVPHSRTTWLAWAALALLLALAAAGAARWRRDTPAGERTAHLLLWATGIVVALAGWAVPGLLDRLAGDVPGVALVRDSSRLLPLGLPLTVGLVAAGVDSVRERLAGAVPRASAALVLALLPLTLMPDAAWGIAGHLAAVRYPAGWSDVRSALAASHGEGDVLVLPWSAYRAPAWNGHRPVLDPLPRWVPRPSVFSGDLVVGRRTVPGEDPRAAAAARALAAPDPAARAAGLRRLGIAYVVTDRTAGPAPQVAGETRHDGDGLLLQALPGPLGDVDRFAPTRAARAAVRAASLVYAATWAAAALLVGTILPRVSRRPATVRAEGEGGHIR